ncbi:hypothetical protein [Sorangium sp. So ce406]|uniref:hypothetical protein n=1 Tax=Sorangium sp. So ce406 TaxID=3133311 RepID=UPI003F5B5B13
MVGAQRALAHPPARNREVEKVAHGDVTALVPDGQVGEDAAVQGRRSPRSAPAAGRIEHGARSTTAE